MMSIDLNNWETQLCKGILELYVLEILSEKPSYGVEVLKKMRAKNLQIQEGTLYPLLNRMQRNGWLESQWKTPETSGHPRRYYNITKESQAFLPQMQKVFHDLYNANPSKENSL